MYKIEYYKKALKDIPRLKSVNSDKKAKALIELLRQNPFKNPPPYEKLIGDLSGYYSRRINIQHRLIYMVSKETHTTKIIRMWTHYDD